MTGRYPPTEGWDRLVPSKLERETSPKISRSKKRDNMSLSTRMNRLWVLGRKSTVAYLRFYPNPGFMIPWTNGRRLVWSKFYGLKIRKA